MMTRGFYIYIRSSQNDDIFPDNTASNFRIVLPKVAQLEPLGAWCVSVVDIKLPHFTRGYKTDFIRVEMDCCEAIMDETSLRPTLIKIDFSEVERGRFVQTFDHRYIPLTPNSLQTLSFSLTDSENARPSFALGSVYCTLHINKRA